MSGTASMTSTENGWRRFWNRGGFWRAILITAAYFAAYNGLQIAITTLAADWISSEGTFADPATVFWGTTASILAGGLLVLAFAATVGWVREIFGRQPIGGSWWMWIAPIVILAFNAIRYASIDYTVFTVGTILMTLFMGLVVGFTEELLTRGVVVNVMRKHGYGEWMVMFVSSLSFALLHSGYFYTSGVLVGIYEVLYTFFFGVLMYLTLRVTGNIIWPILVHASTDPSVFLQAGAIGDADAAGGAVGPLAELSGYANWAVMIVGIVLMIFVRGRVAAKEQATTA